MSDVGKILIAIGLAIALVGALVWVAGKFNLPLGRLPGDIRIERDNFKICFPLMTCILISVLLTLILLLLRKR